MRANSYGVVLTPSELASLGDTYEEAWSTLSVDFIGREEGEIHEARQSLARIMIALSGDGSMNAQDIKVLAIRYFKEGASFEHPNEGRHHDCQADDSELTA